MNIDIDPYQVLGVTHETPIDQIKERYRSLALKYHPDRGGDPNKFKIIKLSFQMIADSLKRGVPITKTRASDFLDLKSSFKKTVAESTGPVAPKPEGKMDLSSFNQKFVKSLEDDKYGYTLVKSTTDYREQRTKDQLLSEKASIDSEIGRIKPIFHDKHFDNNVFQRAFEHINADSAAKAVQVYDEPQALVSGLQPFTEIDGEYKLVKDDTDSLNQIFGYNRNPDALDTGLIREFKSKPNITDVSKLEPGYHNKMKAKLNQLKASPVTSTPPGAPSGTPTQAGQVGQMGPVYQQPKVDFFAKIPSLSAPAVAPQPTSHSSEFEQLQRQLHEMQKKLVTQDKIIKSMTYRK